VRFHNHARPSPIVHLIGGTRPEAIKLAPLADALRQAGRMQPLLVASGQHPMMFQQGLAAFGLQPDAAIPISRVLGSQPELMGQLVTGLDAHIGQHRADAVVVQGDTSTALAAALAAFWRRIPVVHLEAGLRSYDLTAPFPEEANRRLIDQLAALHLAPTPRAAANLTREGVPDESVLVIGNTVVDAVLDVTRRPALDADPQLLALEQKATAGKCRLVLVTVHRRESWGAPLDRVLAAVGEIITRHRDVEVVLPAHPNPAVQAQVASALGGRPRVLVTDPLPYTQLSRLLAASTLVLSDSGGLQEEAPSFAVPVLVLREVTERIEAVEAGCAVLLGTDRDAIVHTATRLLANEDARVTMTATGNPFGDGLAGRRAEQAIARMLDLCTAPPDEFRPGKALHRQTAVPTTAK
jgi:UDP-N-acetylglucosamine 2-epimerase (non-hydrolysing)